MNVLTRAPYTQARHLAEQAGLDRDHIILSYKLIQQTKAAADRLRASPNGDYLNIVHHYFTSRMYVVVFFVGLTCPGRCLFCPNVTVKSDGKRKISRYPATKSECMSEKDIDAVFRDILGMQSLGTSVLVKISGGLKPLSDPATMALILDRAEKNGVHVKSFTNGFLLNTALKRRLTLKADDVRISLSVMDDKAFGDIMLGNAPSRIKKYGLSAVLDNIRNLVLLRDEQGLDTKIGINTIVLEENHRQMSGFIRLAGELGVDYIDFKPNYFSAYQPSTQARLKETMTRIKARKNQYPVGVYAAGSLARDNLLWTHRDGVCRPHKQSRFKLFITPHGHCSPVHHGAFPGRAAGSKNDEAAYDLSRQYNLRLII